MKSIDELCPCCENADSLKIDEPMNTEVISKLVTAVSQVVESNAEQTKKITEAITTAMSSGKDEPDVVEPDVVEE